jgi:hypothetical protein
MKTHMAALCVALIAVFALSACGGGNDANSTKSDDKKEDSTPKTPAEHRQAVANKMKDAFVAFDAEAVKALFLPDEHANVEKRIISELKELKEKGFKVTAKTPTIEEKEGKFFATFSNTVESKDGVTEEDSHTLSIIEKDGKYYMSFTK